MTGAPPFARIVDGFLQSCTLSSNDTLFTMAYKWQENCVHPSTRIYLNINRYRGGANVKITPEGAMAVAWDPAQVHLAQSPMARIAAAAH